MKCYFVTLLVWCSIVLAASAATSPTSKVATSATSKAATTVNTPTKTYCPQFYTTRKSPKPTDYTCGERGTLARPDEISRHCYDEYSNEGIDEAYCYRSCSNEPRCISYAWDLYEKICRLFAKPLIDMGFKIDNSNSSLSHWNLRGCHICQADPLPARPGCVDDNTLKPKEQTKGYFCDALGYTTQDYSAYITFSDYTPFDRSCYLVCRKYNTFGACEAIIYDRTNTFVTCHLINKPLREIGWTEDDQSGPPYVFGTNLLGCYNCTLPPSKTLQYTCTPTNTPVAPVLKNGDFSSTVFESQYDRTIPEYWYVSPAGRSKVVTGVNGNKYLSLGIEDNSDWYSPAASSQVYDFDMNPYLDTRFYNVTFDLALARLNRTGVKSCVLSLDSWSPGVKIDILKLKVSTIFQNMGPYRWDASIRNTSPSFVVDCKTAQNKLDLWIDKVQVWQYGQLVAGAGNDP